MELKKYRGIDIAKLVNTERKEDIAKRTFVELNNVIDVIDYTQDPKNEPAFTAKDKKEFAPLHKDLMKDIRKALK